jgi:uncharacterized protein
MIVDCHVHIWQSPADLALSCRADGLPDRPMAADVSDHMEATQAVDVSLVWGFAARQLDAEVPIDFLGQHLGLQGNRAVGIVGVDPSDPAWRDKLLEAVDEWGFQGVTVCPASQNIHPMDSRALALYELCAERDLPVLFDVPAQWQPKMTMTYARPDLLDGVARDFPNLRILIAAMGYPYVDQTLALLEKFPGVHADTAHLAHRPLVLSAALARAHEAGVLEKVLFGSGFPLAWPEEALATVLDQCAHHHLPAENRLPRDVLQQLVYRDTLAALGIGRPEGFVERHAEPSESEDDLDDS